MCGIAGVLARVPLDEPDRVSVRRMSERLIHRGPDGEGEFQDRHVHLAMRRLSIIDLHAGWQPLFNEDRSLALVANGEIYNFVELRKSLEERGHHFRTGSDCETIVHLYEEHGDDCVRQLRGMFAFALWDSRRRRLLLGRDRMGEKPLYLVERDGALFFASELKAILETGLVKPELDPTAVDHYFHYLYVPEPRTPILGIRKLSAAHILAVDVDPWQLDERAYWRMEDSPPLDGSPAERIREQLGDVSRLIVRSDVPVGVALSGGLDSSALAALASARYPGVMHAFSIGYEGTPPCDERADAKALADHLGMPFHDVEVRTDDVVREFPEVVYHRDDPIADIAGHSYYSVMRLAREHQVPVMLQGQGGDELFWGYPWMREAAAASRRKAAVGKDGWRALPRYCRLEPLPVRRHEIRNWLHAWGGLAAGWQEFQEHRAHNDERVVFYDKAPHFRLAMTRSHEMYTPSFAARLNGAGPLSLFAPNGTRHREDLFLTYLICATYLEENGIAQGDRLSMASSVELRLPLVDYRLVETVIGCRKASPDDRLPPKTWLKEALAGMLPDWVTSRPKRGFTPPTRAWRAALHRRYGHTLSDGVLVSSGLLRPAIAAELGRGDYPSGEGYWLSFAALVLETWIRRFV